MSIKPITCPACGGAAFRRSEDGTPMCAACGHRAGESTTALVCEVCNTANPAAARRCMNCGLALGRLCAACHHANVPAVDLCEACGTPLDRLAIVGARAEAEGPGSVPRRTQRLGAQKAADRAYMARQRDALDREEVARLARLAEQQVRARAEQRRIALWAAAGLLVLLGLSVLALTIVQALPAP